MSTPLDELADAIQKFANTLTDAPELVDNAIVVWEAVSFDGDGEPQRCIRYCVPTANFSMSGALGLLAAGDYYVRNDVLPDRD